MSQDSIFDLFIKLLIRKNVIIDDNKLNSWYYFNYCHFQKTITAAPATVSKPEESDEESDGEEAVSFFSLNSEPLPEQLPQPRSLSK